MDESVCHLQDSSFEVSLGRDGAVPVWVGMGWLATKSGEVPQSKHYNVPHKSISAGLLTLRMTSRLRITRGETPSQHVDNLPDAW